MDNKNQSDTIQELIQISRKKLTNNGLLFILWGWTAFYGSFTSFTLREFIITYPIREILSKSGTVLGIAALGYTIYYLWKHRKEALSYFAVLLRYVWLSMIAAMIMINLIQANVLHKITFELQHPIFMVLFAFSIIITGSILRYKFIIFGGIFFGIMALISSYLTLPYQLLLEALSWLAAFVIPGHLLYSNRKS